jgi:ATP diphosphatase
MSMQATRYYDLNDLLLLMAKLRDPLKGCPWDLKQTFQSIVPSTLEECYELVDAIERQDYPHILEELGDLLFQVVFYSQLGKEEGQFDFKQIISELVEKLLRRHPHLFPDGDLYSAGGGDAGNAEQITSNWEAIKKQERLAKQLHGLLDDIPLALPALSRACKLQKRASTVGFDWADIQGVIDKVREELAELELAIAEENKAAQIDELGDLLFSCVNLARHLRQQPEECLRSANNKFECRFRYMEQQLLADGIEPANADAALMDSYWEKAKRQGF